MAREALIGAAIEGERSAAGRPGDLPCPDLNNDGGADPPCFNPVDRIGRLPWRTLGLPDLRDGNGERLWYAVSVNFKNLPRTTCTNWFDAGCLNSESKGTLTVRSASGALLYNGTNPAGARSGAVAVVFSPGPILTRQSAGAPQDRGCTRGAGVDTQCQSTDVCQGTGAGSPKDYLQTARCNPANYLDVVGPPVLTVGGATASTEDNAVFIDSTSTDGFITGPVRAGSGNQIVNDRLLVIAWSDVMPLIEQRVARDIANCLERYRTAPGSPGLYPYSANGTNASSYAEASGKRFGHVPDSFALSVADNASMSPNWPSNCRLSGVTPPAWWTNWKSQVFFGYAAGYAPTGTASCVAGTDCLEVSTPTGSVNDAKLVVLVAGREIFGTQPRPPPSSSVTNYLEGEDSDLDDTYEQANATSTFNDVVMIK